MQIYTKFALKKCFFLPRTELLELLENAFPAGNVVSATVQNEIENMF